MTVLGNKRDLESKFLEYDEGDVIPPALVGNSANADAKRRQLFSRSTKIQLMMEISEHKIIIGNKAALKFKSNLLNMK